MPGAARLGDTGSGHASWPPTNIIASAKTVTMQSKLSARKGDALAPHASPSPSPVHSRSIAMGSSNVTTESSNQAFFGMPIDCGGMIVTCSDTVIIN